jgi:chromosome segregation ATPase
MAGTMSEDLLSIEQAASLLGVEPSTIRDRIRDGTVQVSTRLTTEGIRYLIDRSSLQPENAVMRRPSKAQRVRAAALADQNESRLESFMQRLLEPLANRLATLSIELGRERQRREVAELNRVSQADEIAALKSRIERAEEVLAARDAELEQRANLLAAQAAELARLEELRLTLQEREKERTAHEEEVHALLERAETAEYRADELQHQINRQDVSVSAYNVAIREMEKLQQFVELVERDHQAQGQAIDELRGKAQRAGERADELAGELVHARSQLEDYSAALQRSATEIEELKQYAQVLEHDSQGGTENDEPRRRRGIFRRRSV